MAIERCSVCTHRVPTQCVPPTTRAVGGTHRPPAHPTDRARERYDPARRRDRGFTTRVESSPARFVDVDATGDLSVRRPSIERGIRSIRTIGRPECTARDGRTRCDGRWVMRDGCARGVCDGRRARVVRGGGARGWIGSSVIFRARACARTLDGEEDDDARVRACVGGRETRERRWWWWWWSTSFVETATIDDDE